MGRDGSRWELRIKYRAGRKRFAVYAVHRKAYARELARQAKEREWQERRVSLARQEGQQR
jgi:hypothetical protein